MRSSARLGVIALGTGAAILCAPNAWASIVYTVDQAIGGGSVTGTVTTDGTIGVLAQGNFAAWNLTLSIPSVSQSYVLTNGNSVVYETGSDVTATATAITFNFSGVDSGILLFQDGLFSGQHYWCNAASLGACYQGETVAPISVFSAYENVAASGEQVIASVSSSVPEPSTWALMLAGFAGLGFAGYRASRKQAASPA